MLPLLLFQLCNQYGICSVLTISKIVCKSGMMQ